MAGEKPVARVFGNFNDEMYQIMDILKEAGYNLTVNQIDQQTEVMIGKESFFGIEKIKEKLNREK